MFVKVLKIKTLLLSKVVILLGVIVVLSGCDTFREDLRPTGANKLSVAKSDHYRTTVNNSIIITPLANDSVFTAARLVMTHPAEGEIRAIGNTDSFIYIPKVNYQGVDSLSYTIYAGSNASNAKITIVVERGVQECRTRTSSDEVTLTTFSSVTFNPAINDLNCDPVQLTGFSQPKNGTLTAAPRGELTYTPIPGFIGHDSATYTICKLNNSDCATGKLTFIVSPNPGCDTTFQPRNDTVWFNVATQSTRIPISSLLSNDRRCQGDINPNTFYLLALPATGIVYTDPQDPNTLIYQHQGATSINQARYSVSNALGTVTRSAAIILAPR